MKNQPNYYVGMIVRYSLVLLVAILTIGTAFGQSKKDLLFQAPTPESRFLDLIDLEEDPAKQLQLIDLFIANNPVYGGMSALWALSQSDCVRIGQFDRALALGEKLLKLDPNDVEAVKLNLEAAQGKKDEALVKVWKDRLDALTREPEESISATSRINLPFVEGPDAPPDSALTPPMRNARARREAVAFNEALQTTNPAAKLELLNRFPQQYPHSQHLQKIQYLKFLTYQELKDDTAALATAEEILAKDRTREDVFFFAAARYFAEKRHLDRVVSYSAQMLALLATKPRPEEFSEAEWEKQRKTIAFQAHYMTGTIHLQAERWQAADASLKDALPYAGGSTRVSILNSLAFANHRLRKIPEAIRYYEMCANIPGAHQEAARKAITFIKNEYELQ